MKKFCIILSLAIVVLLSSCGTTQRTSVYKPDHSRRNIDLTELEYLGECEISVSYSVYFGFIHANTKVNGEDYNSLHKKKVGLGTFGGRFLGPISKATYKVLETYPNAVYFMPVRKTTTRDQLIFGHLTTTTATVRAYALKDAPSIPIEIKDCPDLSVSVKHSSK